ADAAPEQRVRRAALELPHLLRAVLAGDLDVDPRVRVDELDLDDCAPQADGLVRIELGGERVVGAGRRHHEKNGREQRNVGSVTHRELPFHVLDHRAARPRRHHSPRSAARAPARMFASPRLPSWHAYSYMMPSALTD